MAGAIKKNHEYFIIRIRTFFSKQKSGIMGNLLYIIAVVLVVIWAIGFFGYAAGGIIHILLVIAVVVLVFNLISGRRGW